MKWINQYAAMLHLFVTVQYLHSHEQKSMKIACGNGIFAYPPMFSYGQRSKCADLLNSYDSSIIADHGKKKRITANLLFPMCNDRIDIFAGAKIRE